MADEKTQEAGFLAAVKDGFNNIVSRVGLRTQNQSAFSGYGYHYITRDRTSIENAYTSSWVVGRGVDVYAEDMTRAGIDLHTELPPDDVDKIYKALRDTLFWQSTREAVTWARLYGGALMVALIDGQSVETPLDTATVRKGQFRGFAVLDRWHITTAEQPLITELGPDLGQPKYYRVDTTAPVFPGRRIHHSRCVRINGIALPPARRLAEGGWGMSIVERLYERAVALDSATLGMSQLVYKAHLRTLKVKNYRRAVAMGGDSMNGMLAFFEAVRMFQSNEGLTVLDEEDKFDTSTYNFSGLPDVVDKLTEQVCGALQIPLVRLIGQSPKGFSTGETDLQNHDDGIRMEQESKLRRVVAFALELCSRSTFGKSMPEGFDFSFTPLRQMSLSEKTESGAKGAAAVSDAFDKGLIGRRTALMELRALSPSTGLFGSITSEDIEDAEPDPPAPIPEGDAIDPAGDAPSVPGAGEKQDDGGAGGGKGGAVLVPRSKRRAEPGDPA